MRTKFNVPCDSELEAAVKARRDAERRRLDAWEQKALNEVRTSSEFHRRSGERRLAMAAVKAEAKRRREAGEFLPTIAELMDHYLRRVLAKKGWDREYEPVDESLLSMGGRPIGVSPHDARAGDGKGVLDFNVEPKLFTQVRTAAHRESEAAVKELQKWHDRFGDGPGPGDRGDDLAALAFVFQQLAGSGPKQADMARRDELRNKIITSGDIVRMAAYSAVSTTHRPPAAPKT
jgi:hypothetical protein